MNAFCSLFSQILKFIPSSDFEGLCSRPIATRDCRSLASCKLVDLMYQLLPNPGTCASTPSILPFNALPPRQRDFSLLHVNGGLAYKEIAAARGGSYRNCGSPADSRLRDTSSSGQHRKTLIAVRVTKGMRP